MSRWSRVDLAVLLGIVLGAIVVALVVGRDYGISWDEYATPPYGQRTLKVYAGATIEEDVDLAQHGPVYIAFSELVGRAIRSSWPGWSVSDGRHVAYFLSFLAAVMSVYVLARGFGGSGSALAASLLLATQPLLFGHAFINPKDMPFMGLFAGAMAVGIVVARLFRRVSERGPAAEFRSNWASRRVVVRTGWCLAAFLAVGLGAGLLELRHVILPEVRHLVGEAYHGEAPTVVQALFSHVSTDSWKTGLDVYLAKVDRAYRVGAPALALLALIGVASVGLWVFLPAWRIRLYLMAVAGVVAGLATAVRVAGPVAGLLVSALLLYNGRRQAVLALAVYWAFLVLTAYIAWPYLWGDAVLRFVEAWKAMATYSWGGGVLFEGAIISAFDLPWSYALTHYSLQLTLPALALGLVGGIAAIFRFRSGVLRAEMAVLWVWLMAPFAAAIVQDSTLYDGARQMLFAIPPLFVMAAVAFERLFGFIGRAAFRVAFVLAALLPGLAALVSLHPYEYIYFNELAGGVAGAYRRYELDYWLTAYREAMLALDQAAPHGASVAVAGPAELAWPYARPDITVLWREEDLWQHPDFFIATTRSNIDLEVTATCPSARPIYDVSVAGATLARLFDLRGCP